MSNWRFVTNHLSVLIQVAKHPQITMREIAAHLGTTERSVFRIICDLETEGYLTKVRDGRVNYYTVNADLLLSHPELRDVLVGGLLLHLSSHHLVKTILSPTVEGTFNLKAVNAEMTPEILQEVLLGGVVGLMVGLTGAGGAALAIPGMTLLLGVPAMTAVATAFPFTSLTKVFAFLEHRRLGTIHWPVAKYYLIGTIPGTLASVIALSRLYDRLGGALDFWLKLAIGLLLILSVLISLLQRRATAGLAPDPPSALTLSQKFLAVGVSAVLGVIIGATSVGGGSFLSETL